MPKAKEGPAYTCSNCPFFGNEGEIGTDGKTYGTCRPRAPSTFDSTMRGQRSLLLAQHGWVTPDYWCGDHPQIRVQIAGGAKE